MIDVLNRTLSCTVRKTADSLSHVHAPAAIDARITGLVEKLPERVKVQIAHRE